MSDKESGEDGESSSSEPPLEYHVPPEFRQDDDNEDLHIGETMEWSMDHSKILYLISIFARPADGWEGQESDSIFNMYVCVMPNTYKLQ